MKYLPKNDARVDISATRPDLSVNLRDCIETGKIPGTGTVVYHNDIESVDTIGSVIRDDFQAFDAMQRIKASVSQPAPSE